MRFTTGLCYNSKPWLTKLSSSNSNYTLQICFPNHVMVRNVPGLSSQAICSPVTEVPHFCTKRMTLTPEASSHILSLHLVRFRQKKHCLRLAKDHCRYCRKTNKTVHSASTFHNFPETWINNVFSLLGVREKIHSHNNHYSSTILRINLQIPKSIFVCR